MTKIKKVYGEANDLYEWINEESLQEIGLYNATLKLDYPIYNDENVQMIGFKYVNHNGFTAKVIAKQSTNDCEEWTLYITPVEL